LKHLEYAKFLLKILKDGLATDIIEKREEEKLKIL